MMIKKFFNQEEGIALTVAVVVTVILFLIATAYFISTQSESTKVLADKAGVKAIDVANAGAERALWDVQRRLDNDPSWQPAENEELFNTEYDYFRNLSEDKKNPDKYTEKCIQVGSTVVGQTFGSIGGVGSKVYAVKLRRGPEERALGDNIWSIYSLGIDRPVDTLGSKMELRVVRVLVQLGINNAVPLPNGALVTDRIDRLPPNVSTILLPDEDGNCDMIVNNGINETAESPRRRGNFTHEIESKDGYHGEFTYVTNQNSFPDRLKDAMGKNLKIKGKLHVNTTIPKFKLDYFKDKCDWTGDDLVAAGVFEKLSNSNGGKVYVPKGGRDTKKLVFSKEKIHSLGGHQMFNLYNRNGTDTTILYIDGALRMEERMGSQRSQCIPYILIMPETKGIIVARGRWTNTLIFDNDVEGDEGYYMDEENIRNDNIGIDIRAPIRNLGENGKIYGGSVDSMCDAFADNLITSKDVEMCYQLTDDKKPGRLDLLSDYDVLITPPANDLMCVAAAGRRSSVWRGFIYSNTSVTLYQNIYLKGSIMAREKFRWGNQGELGYKADMLLNPSPNIVRFNDDGADMMTKYEQVNAQPGYNIYDELIEGVGGGNGRIAILAWENIKGKQIQKTFY